MQLFIHFGIYKTGSSYLQYLCANSTQYMAMNGYYFPPSPFDKLMQSGIISPGNSGELHNLLKKADSSACSRLLRDWAVAAQKKNCNRVLISGESLVHNFATREGLETLMGAAKQAGFLKISALGYVRDLVDHAMSTYKHRGKSGRIKDFQHWIANIYETPTVLRNFAQLHHGFSIDWTLRKFQKDSGFMARSFFVEWLCIATPSLEFEKRVNESLTVSEIIMINELSKLFPTTIDYFVHALNKLDRSKRADDRDVEQFFRNRAKFVLGQSREVITLVNKLLKPNEQLDVISGQDEELFGAYPVAKLSEYQIRTLMEELKKIKSLPGQVILLRRKVASWLPTFIKKNYRQYILQNVKESNSG